MGKFLYLFATKDTKGHKGKYREDVVDFPKRLWQIVAGFMSHGELCKSVEA